MSCHVCWAWCPDAFAPSMSVFMTCSLVHIFLSISFIHSPCFDFTCLESLWLSSLVVQHTEKNPGPFQWVLKSLQFFCFALVATGQELGLIQSTCFSEKRRFFSNGTCIEVGHTGIRLSISTQNGCWTCWTLELWSQILKTKESITSSGGTRIQLSLSA